PAAADFGSTDGYVGSSEPARLSGPVALRFKQPRYNVMRVVKIEEKADSESLSALLLKANLSTIQSEKALAALQALNPHVDLTKVPAGTVLLVPDMPSFKVSVSDPVLGNALGEFEQVVRTALEQTAANLKASTAARAAERADIVAVLKGAPLRRIIESDSALKQQVRNATKALQEEQQADQAEETLARASKAALAKIAQLRKRLG